MTLTQKINEDDVVWRPIEGSSQEIAIDTRAKHTLYYGTRGPGKTSTQLMFFRQYVGVGYGSFWKGVIFDRHYKNFTDIISQSKRFFLQFKDCKFLGGTSEVRWVWNTGEELLLRHVASLDAYDDFHGSEFCLEENELVCTENGDMKIKDLKVGDKVLTPTGYNKITRIFERRHKKCLLVKIYDAYGRFLGQQYQSEDHRLLVNDSNKSLKIDDSWKSFSRSLQKDDQGESSGKLNHCSLKNASQALIDQAAFSYYPSIFEEQLQSLFDSFYKFLQYNKNYDQETRVLVSDPCVFQENQVFCASTLKEVDNLFLKYDRIRQDFLRQFSIQNCSSDTLLFRNLGLSLQEKSIQLHNILKSFSLSSERKANQIIEYLDSVLLRVSALLIQVLPKQNDAKTCVSQYSYKSQDYQSDYSLYCDHYDELPRSYKENALNVVLLQPDALKTSHLHQKKDVLEDTGRCNQNQECVFLHPYTGKFQESAIPLSRGYAVAFPCGILPTIDIEVENSNNYITTTGVVNRNCFIGYNELTKQPTAEMYDKFMSLNRSSFTPKRDTPKDNKGNYLTLDGKPLPPIPLQIFSTCNPSGAGRNWVKRRFIDCCPVGTVYKKEIKVYDPKVQKEVMVPITQIAIFGSFKENVYLPAEYIAQLMEDTKNNPHLYKAWIEGSWEGSSGGIIDDLWRNEVHIVPRFKIPDNWQTKRCFDWGSTSPFAVVWIAEANGEEVKLDDGEIFCPKSGSYIVFYEWYGGDDFTTNIGLKMSAQDIAIGILDIEELLIKDKWISKTPYPGAADNQIGQVRESDVETIKKKMEDLGVYWEVSDKSKGSRINGLQLMRDMLKSSLTGEGPGLYFMDNCDNCVQTIQYIPRSEKNPDDADTESNDHLYDAVRYGILEGNNRIAESLEMRIFT